jgi:hypothetical protein
METTMQAAVFRKGSIVVDTLPDPEPAEGQVLVRTRACGICGSDLHAAKHTHQFVDLAKRAGNRWSMDADRDVVFGHEFCCDVIEYGPRTPGRLAPGTLVCSMPLTLAGETVQGIGYSNDIAGGFAQYMPLADRMLLAVPNGLPADRGGLACRAARSVGAGGCAAGGRLRSGRAVGHRRVGAEEYPSDHRRRFFTRAPGAGTENGSGYRDRSGGDIALRNMAEDRDSAGVRRQPLCSAFRAWPQAAAGGDL